MHRLALAAGFASVIVSTSAFAQNAEAEKNAFEGDYLIAGVGAAYMPSYRGSDDYVVTPVPVLMGRYKDVEINPRAGGVAVDFIADGADDKFGFSLGPVVTYSGNRARQIKDRVVKRAGKLDSTVELGLTAGVTAYKLLNPYDQLTFSTDVRWDVAGSYKGMVVAPAISYTTPVSKAALVTLNVSALRGDGNYSRYFYSVSPEQSLATGLPEYRAKKGWDSAYVGLLGVYDLDGNLLNGGFTVMAVGAFGKMLNDGKKTPYTRIRGDADQWIGGLGIGYTF